MAEPPSWTGTGATDEGGHVGDRVAGSDQWDQSKSIDRFDLENNQVNKYTPDCPI